MANQNQRPTCTAYDFRKANKSVAVAVAHSYAHARRLAAAAGFSNWDELEDFPLTVPKLPVFKIND